MSDLGPGTERTVTCPACGATNDLDRVRCRACGAFLLGAGTPDAERGDLELEEVLRAFAVDGYDRPFAVGADDEVICPRCRARTGLAPALVDGHAVARDTPTARSGLTVFALHCPGCDLPGYAVFDPEGAPEQPAGGTPDETVAPSARGDRAFGGRAATADHPLGTDREHFVSVPDGDTRSLRERGPLLDEDGTDIREYTGEPVETEEGTVIPQQQNVGPGNMAGEGEWPDPQAPPARPRD